MRQPNKYISNSLLLLAASLSALANSQQIEEVVVLGRLQSSAGDIVAERMQQEVVTDILGSDQIERVGDSTVAAALRRVPGLTLVDGKFIYVRGLGERYSSTTLNKASVPSPDLSRSVIPLDIFPTSVVESISIQKSYSADQPAAFGGGSIDIRTQGIPRERLFEIEIGTGFNTETSSNVIGYAGGSDDWLGTDDGTRALSPVLQQALTTFRGEIDPGRIQTVLNNNPATAVTFAEAQEINRQLATELNRDLLIREQDAPMPLSAEVAVGDNYRIGDDWELGFLGGLNYGNSWRNTNLDLTGFSDTFELQGRQTKSVYSVNLVGNANTEVRWRDDHKLELNYFYIRNTDDEASILDQFSSNRPFGAGLADRLYSTRFEERALEIVQLAGFHQLGADSQELLRVIDIESLEELSVEWYYSDSNAQTSIPNETLWSASSEFVPGTFDQIGTRINSSVQAADHRFTDLDDHVLSYGWETNLPLYFNNWDASFTGGFDHVTKDRSYRQTQFGLGTTALAAAPLLGGPLDQVFSDNAILDPANGFIVNVSGSNAESYLAASKLDAVFAKVDLRFGERWRFAAGLRSENYRQVGLAWDPLAFNGPQISMDPVVLANSVFTDESLHPSAAITYTLTDFWARNFQLRAAYGETTVRPDLREITPSSYINPITDVVVFGNAGLIPSTIRNYDLRAEWFFSTGDNFTVSLFQKDIADPIEIFEFSENEARPSTRLINAESAKLRGVEVEVLHSLTDYAEFLAPFFVASNLTWLDNEITVGNRAPTATSQTRALAGASEYVVNFQVGYDSWDGRHSGAVAYNVFGERLTFAGRNGAPDAFEQPFNSLDLVYSFYPTDQMTFKLKLQNLLDESVNVERNDIVVSSQKIGLTGSLGFKWSF